MEDNIAVIIGVSGLLFTMIQIIRDFLILRRETLKEYFDRGNSLEFQKLRLKVHKNSQNYKEDEELIVAMGSMIEYFEYWARLQRIGYLPLSVFKDSAGIGVCSFYKVVEKYIEERRGDNKFYACNYEWLCKKIKKRYKRNFDT